jgi:hypothetical protein
MGPTWVAEDLSLSFARGDDERRLEFGRQLAGYVRRHRERWDITAVLEPVQLLGSKTGEVNVHLHRCAQGQLAVTIQFQLGPAGPQTAACGQRANARNPFRASRTDERLAPDGIATPFHPFRSVPRRSPAPRRRKSCPP